MNKLRRSLSAIGFLLVISFFILSIWFAGTVYSKGAGWAGSSYNKRFERSRAETLTGDICDRYGVVLASTDADGNRHYHSDEAVRRAVSQTVGDPMSMSGTGVEKRHAELLSGYSSAMVDRMSAALTGEKLKGDSITLTLDAKLCRYISTNFPAGYEGAVCVINYKTGEILATVSKNDYDPQYLVDTGDISVKGASYFNRCLQGQYTPGSIFKVVTLTAALETSPEIAQSQFYCTASQEFGNTTVTCQSGTLSHGKLNLQSAFTRSCNCAFASIGCMVGEEALQKTAKDFGFGDDFAFRDVLLYTSSIASQLDSVESLAWTSVGQGQTMVTPLHMAMIAGGIANRGVMMEPLLLLQVQSSGGLRKMQATAVEYRRICSAETANTIRKYMYKAVEEGTGRKAQISGFKVCGKTGSAEISEDKSVDTNAWFIGFLPNEEYPYAISVVIEQGGAGGDKAAKLAAQVLGRAVSLADSRNAAQEP